MIFLGIKFENTDIFGGGFHEISISLSKVLSLLKLQFVIFLDKDISRDDIFGWPVKFVD